jgi:hypothetical protein
MLSISSFVGFLAITGLLPGGTVLETFSSGFGLKIGF